MEGGVALLSFVGVVALLIGLRLLDAVVIAIGACLLVPGAVMGLRLALAFVASPTPSKPVSNGHDERAEPAGRERSGN